MRDCGIAVIHADNEKSNNIDTLATHIERRTSANARVTGTNDGKRVHATMPIKFFNIFLPCVLHSVNCCIASVCEFVRVCVCMSRNQRKRKTLAQMQSYQI